MKLSPALLAALAFLCAGGLSAVAAQSLARLVEDRSVDATAEHLEAEGHDWVRVLGDGLQIVLEGEAPSEADRFEAISDAGSIVDPSRVIDNMQVADAAPPAPPDFAVEILRNDAGVSLIGLIPADSDRDRLLRDVARAAGGEDASDLLETADHPAPDGWEPALDFALDALELLPHAKISVHPGRVSIDAITDSPEEQRDLEARLTRMAPEGLRLGLAVSAPRPVIAPFTVRATLSGGRLAFDACSADTVEARAAILAAAFAAGAEGPVDCRLGLGTPTPEWGDAVATGLSALHDIGAGTLTFSDADVALTAPPGTDPALFDRVAGALDGALPDLFSLDAPTPEPVAAAATTPQGPPEFTATLLPDGTLRLSGPIEDARMNGLARAFAQARFGAEDVVVATRPGTPGLPPGWAMRVLTGIEALSPLAEGSATVTPDAIRVQGRTGHAEARDEIAARAIETLGPGAALTIQVAYDEALDPLAALPSPEECLARITAVTDAAKITFDPGSATIAADGEPVVAAIAEILRSCPDLRLRIAGYTDSQGRESSNLALSQSRAEAVLASLRAERVPVAGFEAQGFGEADPIASNESEAGREANRRIEFTLIGEEAAAIPAADFIGPLPLLPHDEAAQPMSEAPALPRARPEDLAPDARSAEEEAAD